ncbi:zinc finger, C2H2 type [Oesophagostomum dentatum]|uniref:Zinc finger, C2H2 type n=1 Tax=Oesophagostomum dentatum TaxID=61180 RepID=A0A0B1TV98_OESDE|nr:zinc finger, C2H2 type [Oesophagostomum dentatum]
MYRMRVYYSQYRNIYVTYWYSTTKKSTIDLLAASFLTLREIALIFVNLRSSQIVNALNDVHMKTIEWTESDSPTPSPNSVPEKNSPIVVTDESPSFEETSAIQELPLAGPKTSKTAHVCPHCNFTTYMSQHMKSHLVNRQTLLAVSPSEPHCLASSFSLPTPSLALHQDAHERHQGQMYQCDICHMQFSQKANMHRHRTRHTGIKPYECRYCKKRFFRKDQMQEHSMTHIKTGVDFDCPVAFCAHQFSQHSTLRSHLEEAHNVCASSPASCKRCSLLFANPRRLLLHYQTRHDDKECRGVASKKENDVSLKKRRPLSASVSPSQIRPVCKKDFSPHRTDSSEISSSPDWDQRYIFSAKDEGGLGLI